MRSPTILSALALIATLVNALPHRHNQERDASSEIDVIAQDFDELAAESPAGPSRTTQHQTQAPSTQRATTQRQTQTQAPATQRTTQRESQAPATQRTTQRETQRPTTQTQRPETQRPTTQTQRPETQRPTTQTQRPETQSSRITFTAPVQTYTQPRETTQTRQTYTAPVQTITQPRETRTEPRQTSTQPVQTYTQPRQTSTRETRTEPVQTYTQPRQTSTRETRTEPVQTYTQPRQTSTRETRTEPVQTYTQPRQTSTRETRTEPVQTYTQPRQTSTRETYTSPRQTYTEPRQTYTQSQSTRTNPRETFTPPVQTYTQPRSTYTPPVQTYTSPRQTYTNPRTTYTTPRQSQSHYTHHRSENGYTTIYVSYGTPTTYYQPVWVQPTYYQPTITLAPKTVTYTTVYVYPSTDSDDETWYSTVTSYVTAQAPITSTVYQTYVAPPATATQAGPGAEPTAGINPWAASCPLPSSFIVNDFVSDSGGVSLSISYNGGTFKCPNTGNNEVIYNGMSDMYCDDDGLVRVITDGSSWLWVSQWSWCNAVPATGGNMPTLEASTNYTNFGYYALDCTAGANGKQACKQGVQDFTIPVTSYGLGGAIGFEPLDINGNYLPGCPSVANVQPIVTNTASCASVQAQETGLTTVTIIA